MTSAPAKDLNAQRIPLSRERIIEAAMALVDEHGVDALSMRRLGAALGVEAMSIYNHIANKEALLQALVEEVVAQIEIPPIEDDWEERLKKMTRSYRAFGQAHPNFVVLMATRPYYGLPVLRQVETIFEILEAAGVDESVWTETVRSLSAFSIGFTLAEVSGFLSGETQTQEREAFDYAALIEEFPRLVRMAPNFVNADDTAQFEYGLDLFISGLKTKIKK